MEEPTSTPVPQSEPLNPKAPILPWLGGIAAALVVGFLIGLFVFYLPTQKALTASQSDLAATKAELETTQKDLETSQSALTETQSDLESAEFNAALTDLENSITYTRLAIATRDLLTARLELTNVDNKFSTFKPLLTDEDLVSALDERLKSIRTSITSDSTKALEQLRIFSENLARVERK